MTTPRRLRSPVFWKSKDSEYQCVFCVVKVGLLSVTNDTTEAVDLLCRIREVFRRFISNAHYRDYRFNMSQPCIKVVCQGQRFRKTMERFSLSLLLNVRTNFTETMSPCMRLYPRLLCTLGFIVCGQAREICGQLVKTV